MRTLLTGATGYIGLHVVRELLQDGHRLTVLVRSPKKLGPFAHHPQLMVVQTDLEDQSRVARALAGHTTCVHAALIWGEPGSEFEMRDTAVAAKLFEAAGSAGLTRCIYVSSAGVHRPFKAEMDEEDPLVTADMYGATKAAGELTLRAACAAYQTTGIVVRPGPVVGPPAFDGGAFRTPNRISRMVAAARNGRAIDVVKGEGRQFSDVATVARVLRLLTRTRDPHPTYLCVDHDVVSWSWVAQAVVDCLDPSGEVRITPREASGPVPRFRTERVEELLGGPSDARDALVAHIRHLAKT